MKKAKSEYMGFASTLKREPPCPNGAFYLPLLDYGTLRETQVSCSKFGPVVWGQLIASEVSEMKLDDEWQEANPSEISFDMFSVVSFNMNDDDEDWEESCYVSDY